MEDLNENTRTDARAVASGKGESRVSHSLRVRLGLVIALGVSLIVATVLALQFTASVKIGRYLETRNARLTTELLAGQMGQPLQTHAPDRIVAIYESATTRDPTISAISVLDADGGTVAEFARQGIKPDTIARSVKAAAGAAVDGPVSRQVGQRLFTAVPVFMDDATTRVGTLVAAWDQSPLVADIRRETANGLAIGAALTVLGLAVLVYLIKRMIVQPMRALGNAMGAVARRDFDMEIPCQSRGDEIGDLAAHLAEIRDALCREDAQQDAAAIAQDQRQKFYTRLSESMAELANGKTDCEIDLAEFDDLGAEQVGICTYFNDVLHNLQDMLSTLNATTESVRQSALEISEVTDDQSKRSEAQAATLEESAAAIEMLNHSVQQTAVHAADAAQRIGQNRKQAETGGEIVDRTVAAMKQIEDSARQISAITGVIEDIGFQTNLLALNAGVEAARAGEAGRGFAVVASEVRALAQRASDSANEIKTLITTSGEHVTRGSALASEAGNALKDIISGVGHVSELVSQIATGSSEQARNLAEIKDGVSDLDTVTQQNAAVTEETSAASRTLCEEAERIRVALERFRFAKVTSTDESVDMDQNVGIDQPPADTAWEDAALSDTQQSAESGWTSDVDFAEESGAAKSDHAGPSVAFVSHAAAASATALASEEGWDDF